MGDIAWQSMYQAFINCDRLKINATDVPDLSAVTTMSRMFYQTDSLEDVGGSMNTWDVSTVTQMDYLFGRSSFNDPVSAWDVSNVTTMERMFFDNVDFNQPIGSWDVSAVTDMNNMFRGSLFNQDIGAWDVSAVTDMSNMFQFNIFFNQDISAWNVSNVSTMVDMFHGAGDFNQPIGTWDASSVTDMSYLFYQAFEFNQDISSWDVSNVTNMSGMFGSAVDFNQDLSAWDVSSVTNMSGMFFEARDFNQNLGNWDITAVTNVANMLLTSGLDTYRYDSTLIGWSQQNVRPNLTLHANLNYCESVSERDILINTYGWTINFDQYDCSGLPDAFITYWFISFTSSPTLTIPVQPGDTYNYDIDWENDGIYDDFGVTGPITHTYPFGGGKEVAIRGQFPRIRMDLSPDRDELYEVRQWGTTKWSSMERAFEFCTNLNFNMNNLTDVPDLSQCSSMDYMFKDAISLNRSLDDWNVSNVTSMRGLFQNATNFNQSIAFWNVSNVTDMAFMFDNATNFNQPIGAWDVSNVTDMSWMFNKASNFNHSLSTWDVSSVTNMFRMFGVASNFNQDISAWDVSSVSTMNGMFSSASNFDQDISSWDVSSVTDIGSMFYGTNSFNQDISGWDVSNVTYFSFIFSSAAAFNQNMGAWDLASATSIYSIFRSSGLDCDNYSGTLQGWAANSSTPSNLSMDAQGLTYGTDVVADRDYLINTLGWTITGDNNSGTTCLNGPLPVELLHFSAVPDQDEVRLEWSTQTEINTAAFVVERSRDGRAFSELSTLVPTGGPQRQATYRHFDPSPYQGSNYYRLRILDFDGSEAYSLIEVVTFDGERQSQSALRVSPNPSSGRILLSSYQPGAYRILDALGRQVASGHIVAAPLELDLSALPAGWYALQQQERTVRFKLNN